MYNIYFAETANQEMQCMSAKRLNQLSDRMDRLRLGQWKNGTRVKKLRSINKQCLIYEARADQARRMLFTIIKNRNGEKASLLIFHFEVEHDNVIRTASQLFQEDYSDASYNEEQDEELEFNQIVDETSPVWMAEEDHFYQYLNQLKSYEFDDSTLLRMLSKAELSDDELWEIKLSLSREQRKIAMANRPLLLSGTAGSGKTTIVIHTLLETPTEWKKLYITYTKDLCKESEKMFHRLVKGLDQEAKYIQNTRFCTFDEMLYSHLYDRFQEVVGRERFFREYGKYAKYRNLETKFPKMMVWEEIRGVWKSGQFVKDGYILPMDTYLQLTHEQAPNFTDRRKGAYEIFEWYQQFLQKESKIDEQDLLYHAIKNVSEEFELVICDEVQDLSTLHIKFLYHLAGKQVRRLILAGDDQQILHHSGFRWTNINEMFFRQYDIRIPNLQHLEFNYRCSGAITDLAMSINQIQRQYSDVVLKSKPSRSLHQGEKPLLLQGMKEEEMASYCDRMGPHQAIIVRTPEQKKELRDGFLSTFGRTPLIFSITEIKGLEYERIVLWELYPPGSEENQMWEHVQRSIYVGQDHKIKSNPTLQRSLRYDTNILYVAVTRGMKHCYIYQGKEPAAFWQIPSVASNLTMTNLLHESYETDQARVEVDWVTEGNRLLAKKLYQQAKDCFARVNSSPSIERLQMQCEAHLEYEQENYTLAAEYFELAEQFEDALRCYEIVEDYQVAAKLCQQLERKYRRTEEEMWKIRNKEYKIKMYDKIPNWIGAGIECNQLNRHLEAAHRFEHVPERRYFARDMYRKALAECQEQEIEKRKYIEEKLKAFQ